MRQFDERFKSMYIYIDARTLQLSATICNCELRFFLSCFETQLQVALLVASGKAQEAAPCDVNVWPW